MKKSFQSLAESVGTEITKENVPSMAKVIWYELQKRKKLGALDNFLRLVAEFYSKKEDKVRAFAYTAEKMNSLEIEKLKEKLEKKYQKKIDITNIVDESLIGGIKIEIGDSVSDLSYKGKLIELKNKLAIEE